MEYFCFPLATVWGKTRIGIAVAVDVVVVVVVERDTEAVVERDTGTVDQCHLVVVEMDRKREALVAPSLMLLVRLLLVAMVDWVSG